MILFEANDFLNGVMSVKTFWLSSKLNKLVIVGHKDARKVDFISINRDTGLETVVSIPAYVEEDISLYIKTVNSFYSSVETLQQINVGKKNPLKLRLKAKPTDKKHFSIEVSLPNLNIAATKL